MNTILTIYLRTKVIYLFCLLSIVSVGYTVPASSEFFSKLEQHLRSLKTLELHYESVGEDLQTKIVGKMLWEGRDRFLHDTPEWTLCIQGTEGWRHLKKQNTLIFEGVKDEKAWLPENVLFSLKQDVKPISLEQLPTNNYVLTLKSKNQQIEGNMVMTFPQEGLQPISIKFSSVEETVVEYIVKSWIENKKISDSLFMPPQVSSENIIDFRSAAGDK